MKQETPAAVYDDALRVEAYRLAGAAQPFPRHFHEYYVIGFLEAGARVLSCRGRTYAVRAGDILLFCPGDSHACAQRGGGAMDYRGLNIPEPVMRSLASAVTGRQAPPGFSGCVIADAAAACRLRELHRLIMGRACAPEKEEALLLLLSLLLRQYGRPPADESPACREEIERACAYMERHFAERIGLEQLCRCAGLSKSALLRAFLRAKGVTPYRYLENLRVGRAKALLEQGISPVEAALRTGFSDQSHFTRYFHRFIGLTPGAYQKIFLRPAGTGEAPHGQ